MKWLCADGRFDHGRTHLRPAGPDAEVLLRGIHPEADLAERGLARVGQEAVHLKRKWMDGGCGDEREREDWGWVPEKQPFL